MISMRPPLGVRVTPILIRLPTVRVVSIIRLRLSIHFRRFIKKLLVRGLISLMGVTSIRVVVMVSPVTRTR